MFEGKLTESVKNQICCTTWFKEGNIKIDVVPVRQQENRFECGVYAIVLMTFVVNEEILQAYLFMRKKLRVY